MQLDERSDSRRFFVFFSLCLSHSSLSLYVAGMLAGAFADRLADVSEDPSLCCWLLAAFLNPQ